MNQLTLILLSFLALFAMIEIARPIIRRLPAEYFANEAVSEVMLTFANQLAPDAQGWVQLAPYGDIPNVDARGKAVIQRFAKADAENIVNEFASLSNLPQRLFGLPWYVGHPDHPRFKALHTDTKAYGRVKGLEAREDGLYANVSWSPAGKQLVAEEAFHGHSVNWRALPGGFEGGKQIFRPISLKSVGFTNEPQIPVQPATLANEDPGVTKTVLPPWVLTLAGFALDASPTEDEVRNAINAKIAATGAERIPNVTPMELSIGDQTFALQIAGEAPAGLAAEIANQATSLKAAQDAFSAERKSRAELVVTTAIAKGLIIQAKRESAITELANSGEAFASKAQALLAAAPVIKTASITAGIAGKNVEMLANAQARTAAFATLMEARAKAAPDEDYDTRYNAVAGSPAGQALLTQMTQAAQA